MTPTILTFLAGAMFGAFAVTVGGLLAAADLWAEIDGEAREDYVDRMREGGL